MYLKNNKTYISQSFPFLRGNVNVVDKVEFKNIKMNNKINNIGTPLLDKVDTSPQIRERLKYYYPKNYTQKAFNNAKQLRKKENTTEAEKLLWYYIKNKQLNNYKFRRQVAIGNYVVDFLCPEKKIIIELDGGQHNKDKNIKYDENRTKYLNNLGYNVLRFWDNEIFKNMNDVLQIIYNELEFSPSLRRSCDLSTPPPLWGTSPQSGEGLIINKGN